MNLYRLALPALALVLGTSALLVAQEGPPQGPPPQDRDHQHFDHDRGGWDAPPQEFRDIQRQGFHDGIEAARNDFEMRHHPDVNRRNEFRHPPVPRPVRDEYRQGFSRGYEMAFSHLRDEQERR